MYAAKISIFFDTYTREQQKNLILLHPINFFSYKLLISVLLHVICLIAYLLTSFKNVSIHHSLFY